MAKRKAKHFTWRCKPCQDTGLIPGFRNEYGGVKICPECGGAGKVVKTVAERLEQLEQKQAEA